MENTVRPLQPLIVKLPWISLAIGVALLVLASLVAAQAPPVGSAGFEFNDQLVGHIENAPPPYCPHATAPNPGNPNPPANRGRPCGPPDSLPPSNE